MGLTSDKDDWWFKKLEEDGVLRDELSSLGWAFWPKDQEGNQMGFFDEGSLRRLADEIERRNKPFWDAYNKACEEEARQGSCTRGCSGPNVPCSPYCDPNRNSS